MASTRAVDPTKNPWDPTWITSSGAPPLNLGIHYGSMAYMVDSPPRPNWDWRAFDFETGRLQLARLSEIIDATSPDLDAFRVRGGKLLMYHGTADPGLVFGMSVDFRNALSSRYGAALSEFYRLLPMPGMYHCRGGYGPDHADFLDAIVEWVEGGQSPDHVVATQLKSGAIVRTRPLCNYPAYARYQGGDATKAASFECTGAASPGRANHPRPKPSESGPGPATGPDRARGGRP
jgi:feruloyl esterase